jgi:hypothetical protein
MLGGLSFQMGRMERLSDFTTLCFETTVLSLKYFCYHSTIVSKKMYIFMAVLWQPLHYNRVTNL